jgi:hydroxypyruvate reductase
LSRDTELGVEELASRYLARARRERPEPGTLRVLIGNGEPRLALPRGGAVGRGGRSTHLALLMARGLASLPEERRARTAFLAAGTDDRDGNSDVSGAAVDGTTLARAHARGLDAGAALAAYDSLPVLAATGDTIRGPGTSNLLDLHLLAIG